MSNSFRFAGEAPYRGINIEPQAFKHPGKEYRGVPFWSWNDALHEAELVRQIGEIDAQGMGGFFMHSRAGLVTPYLSNEWMAMVRTCVAEAKRRGMGAWLYDEDRWPSGFAGGLVTSPDPARRAKALVLRPSPIYRKIAEEVATFVVQVREGQITDVERMTAPPSEPSATSANQLYLHFYLWTSPPTTPWFQGFAYADILDPETVRAFIEANYEPYWQAIGEEFGATVPGIFTDEPNFFFRFAGIPQPSLPWTTRLPEVFAAAHGYDIVSHLPSLFYDVDDFLAVRYDFWRTVTDLFVDSYTRQIFQWCEQRGLKLTGHLLLEESALEQTRVVGAAMPHYEFMHLPGMDHLNLNIANPLTAKQLDSVACQLDKSRAVSELYGCSGQNMSFVDRKWIADWHLVLGINFLNHHLSLYSMRGGRKRDFPPNIFFQQPWWPYNHLIDDYSARLCYALTQGQRVVDVLVIHPIAGAWTLFRPEATHAVMALDQRFAELIDNLLRHHRDFHLGDESILARHGRVDGAGLRVGNMLYPVVVVPSINTLARSTYELLAELVQAGGELVVIEPAPTLIEGRPAEELAELFARSSVQRIHEAREDVAQALASILPPDVKILDADGHNADGVWYHLRRDSDRTTLFLANTDRERSVDTAVDVRATGQPQLWNAASGEIETLASESFEGLTRMRLHFEPAGSHLVVIDRSVPAPESPPLTINRVRSQDLDQSWQVERLDPNTLTLDYCNYQLHAIPVGLEGHAGGSTPDIDTTTGWSRLVPVWQAERAIRANYGRSWAADTWYNVQPGIEMPFALHFTFDVSQELMERLERLALVVETPDRFTITLNGAEVPSPSGEWWIDPSWLPSDIAGLVRGGKNVIQIEGTFFHDTELESCYLVGDFELEDQSSDDGERRFRLVREVIGTRQATHLELQGLPFYAGRLRLRQIVNVDEPQGEAFVEFGRVDAIVVRVRINGRDAGAVGWHPWRVEISGLLRSGQNTIELELYTSLRNLLGPHHNKLGELPSVGPASFSDEANWTDLYTLVPVGVEDVRLVWRA